MLSIKRVLALDNTGMYRNRQGLCRSDEGIHHIYICNGRILYRRVFPRRTFHSHRACGNNDVSSYYIRLHAPTCAHADKCVCTGMNQFLKRYRRRRTPYSSGCNTNLLTAKISRICDKFPAICNKLGIFKIFCYRTAPFRISRHDNIPPNQVFIHLYMILQPLL